MLNGFDWLSKLLISIDAFKIHWWKSNKQHIDDYYEIISAVDETTLKMADGTMLSFYKLSGYGSILNDRDKLRASKVLEERLKGYFLKPGHQIQLVDLSDPSLTRRRVQKSMQPSLDELKRIGLGNALFTTDYMEHVIRNSVWKEQFLVVKTSPISIQDQVFSSSQPESDDERAERLDKERFVSAILEKKSKDQGLFLSSTDVETLGQHKVFAKTAYSAFAGIGSIIKSMDVNEGLRIQKEAFYGDMTPENWIPNLVGLDIVSQPQTDNTNTASLKEPDIAAQVLTSGARDDSLPVDVMQLGERYYSTVSLIMGQPGEVGKSDGLESMKSYAALLAMLPPDLGYITSINIESEPFKTLEYKVDKVYVGMSGILPFTDNYQIRKARTAIENRHKERIEISVYMTMTVTVHAKTLDELSKNKRTLLSALDAWGGAKFRHIEMDKFQGVISTAPGATVRPGLTRVLESLSAAFYQSPLFMDGIPYESGFLHFITDQRRPFPMEEQSSKNINFNAYTCGQSGTGKSTLLTLFNLALLAKPKVNPDLQGEIPLIFNVDFGKTSFGFTKMTQRLADESKKHLFMCHDMSTNEDSAYNVHDLPLGRKRPTMRHKGAIVRFLAVLICGVEGNTASGFKLKDEDMVPMISFFVDEVYNMLDDNNSPHMFDPFQFRHEKTLQALKNAGITPTQSRSYHSLADELMLKDPRSAWHAIILRRYAMPKLSDYSLLLSTKPELAKRYAEYSLGGKANYKDHFLRRLAEVTKEFPCFNLPTRINVDLARMISIDIKAVCGEDEYRKAVFGSLCLLMFMTKKENSAESDDFFHDVDQQYLPYLKRLNNINRFLPGVLNIEEAHVLINLFEPVLNDAQRQNRKANWGLKTYSQRITDPSDVFFDLCSAVFVTSDQAAEEFQPRFNAMRLTDTEQHIMKSGLSNNITSFMAYIKVVAEKEGDFNSIRIRLQALVTSGLIWASNSNQLDAQFFGDTVDKLGFDEAIIRLQNFFPLGRVRQLYEKSWIKDAAATRGFDSVYSYFLDAISKSRMPDAEFVSLISRE